jgi:hypothetical protein
VAGPGSSRRSYDVEGSRRVADSRTLDPSALVISLDTDRQSSVSRSSVTSADRLDSLEDLDWDAGGWCPAWQIGTYLEDPAEALEGK